MRERDVTKSLSYVFDQSHHPHMGRCLKTDKECTQKKTGSFSTENNIVALSATDTICCGEVEHDAITCVL